MCPSEWQPEVSLQCIERSPSSQGVVAHACTPPPTAPQRSTPTSHPTPHPLTPRTREAEQISKFKTSLIYSVSSRIARATETLPQKTKEGKRKEGHQAFSILYLNKVLRFRWGQRIGVMFIRSSFI